MGKVEINATRFGKVAVLMGGDSSEREISLQSGEAVLKALKSSGVDAVGFEFDGRDIDVLLRNKIDRVVIMLHGKNGEDGTVQGALDLLGIPYTGSGVLSSALAMDKVRAKKVWLQDGLPTPDFVMLNDNSDFEKVISEMRVVFVKPVKEGSSIGISKASNVNELREAYTAARKFDTEVMAEVWVNGAEFSVPVLRGKTLPAIELKTENEFYDYEAKYQSTTTRYICPVSWEEKKEDEVRALSFAAYESLGCTGWGRVDLMQDAKGKFWLLEVNTVPGMSSHSLVPMSALYAGLNFEQLVLTILQDTLESEEGVLL